MNKRKIVKPRMDRGKAKAIIAVKTASALADKLGISSAAVSLWDKIPLARVEDVERITGVPRAELRPDIYKD